MKKYLLVSFILISLLLSGFTWPGSAAPAGDTLGPDLEDFPPGVSPLTGLAVSDPSNLSLPAVLVSLSNFPPTVRPQTGLSFAPQVYEIYITEGMTRFLTVFYGELPRAYAPPTGDQPISTDLPKVTGPLLGNLVWLDENGNNLQDPWEPGISGVKVDLEQTNGALVASTTTDGNGYFAFQPAAGNYKLHFYAPIGYQYVKANVGSAVALDSDALSADGRTAVIKFSSEDLSQDAGMLTSSTTGSSSTGETSTSGNGSSGQGNNQGALMGQYEQPGDYVSGVRSGREAYVPILQAFPGGCLVAASKSAAVNVPICKNVYSRPGNINSAGLASDQLKGIAEANLKPNRPVNYSGNIFSTTPPDGGQDVTQLNVFYSWLNQSYWKYDPVSQAFLRFEDYGSEDKVGQFRQSIDRLTGQPLEFNNVVILFVEHVVRRPTIIDLNMEPGTKGRAIVLRNGQLYTNLIWSTVNEAYEKSTGLARPVRLRYADGTPFPLAQGNTWFHVATTYSAVWQTGGAGVWKYRFYAPSGSLQ